MNDRTLKHLYDIREAGRTIVAFVAGKTLAEYRADLLVRSAVERQFTIVGEAIGRLKRDDPATLASLTDVGPLIAFRNIVVHAYETIDDSTVWEIIERHLPILLSEVESLMLASGDWPPIEDE